MLTQLRRATSLGHSLALWRWRKALSRNSNDTERPGLDFDWKVLRYNRVAVINAAAWITEAQSYLEIGCSNNASFDSVPLPEKVGVDPVRGGTHRMTSDAFFEQNNRQFDLIFIDGLHEYGQAERDIENALECLSPEGVIVIHDCLPVTWSEQAVPRVQSMWTGDVWKAVFGAKERDDLDLRVVAVDHGCALIANRPTTDSVSFGVDSFDSLGFAFYVQNYQSLGIVSFPSAIDFLRGI